MIIMTMNHDTDAGKNKCTCTLCTGSTVHKLVFAKGVFQ